MLRARSSLCFSLFFSKSVVVSPKLSGFSVQLQVSKVCLYTLLGVNIVAGQLDFGTYNIVNRASQSSLCFHDAGGAIYVSPHRDLRARKLWVLGPGDADSLYTLQGAGLDPFVGAIKSSSSVVVGDGITSFAVSKSSAGGNGYIIKLPNSDLVWTVGSTVISNSEILLQPETNEDTQLWTFIPTDDTVGHKSFIVQTRSPQEDENDLTVVHDIGKSSEIAGFEDVAWAHTVFALGSVWSFIVYTRLSIVVAGQFTGSGTAWGLGLNFMELGGILSYNDEDTLLSAENDFVVLGGGVGGVADVFKFTINGQPVARMVLGGAGGGFVASDGTLNWSKD